MKPQGIKYNGTGGATSAAKLNGRFGVSELVAWAEWVDLEVLKRQIDRGWRHFFHKRHMPLPKVGRFAQ